MSQIKFHVNGKFRIEAPNAVTLTPTGAKECGLLALLLHGQDGERARGWIQAHLWSDRGPDQAASSLRQAVYRVKKSLGPYGDLIQSNRQSIRLDLAKLEIVANEDLEYFEGLDVRDGEFETWLTTERSRRQEIDLACEKAVAPQIGQATTRLPPQSLILASAPDDTQKPMRMQLLEQFVSDGVARCVTESTEVQVFRHANPTNVSKTWRLNVEASELSTSRFLIRISISDQCTDRVLWSENTVIREWDGGGPDNEQVVAFIQCAAVAFNELLLESGDGHEVLERPDVLCSLGIGKLLRTGAADIAEADQLFSDAFARKPRGLYLAWRAQVRQFQLVERLREDHGALREEAEAFVRRAFEMEPNNSMVLASLASFNLHFSGDTRTGLEFALRAVRRNFGNAVAWWSLSSAHLMSDNPTKAYGAARLAVRMAQGTPLEFWTLSLLAGTAIAVRDLDDAKRRFKTVAFGRPEFRPPLRHLLAIHASHEEWDDAMAAVRRLQELEPDFSIDQFANDRAYPVSLLHRSVDLDRDRILSLI